MDFSDLGLSPKVLSAIAAAGYTVPTPIQEQAIPSAVAGKDVLGIAQTGTGKTAGYVLPMLTRLEQGRARARMPRSLILCPTRELAAQVAENFDRYGVNHKLNMALLIGGVSFDEQNRKLDRGADVLIATPGRLLDHFQRGKLLMTGVEILVIDEADRMLDMGFIPDIERICSLLPPARQTLFFSATMPPEIQRLVDKFLRDPTRVEVAPQATAASTIEQRFKFVDGADWDKRDALREMIRGADIKNAIIFCNRKVDVDILYKSLVKHGFDAGCLHGDMDQHSRTATLDGFRAGNLKLLVASDVAARGLDIPDVSHVFNFDVPVHAEDYVHRIGRTGRAGRKGTSLTLVTDDGIRILDEIEKMLKMPLEWIGDPPPADAGSKARKRGRGGRGERPAPRQGRGGPRREAREPGRDAPAPTSDTQEPLSQTSESGSEPRASSREGRVPGRTRRDRGPRRDRVAEPVSAVEAAPIVPANTGESQPLREEPQRPRNRQAERSEPQRERPQPRARSEQSDKPRRQTRTPRDSAAEPPLGAPTRLSRPQRDDRTPRDDHKDRPLRRERDDSGPSVVGLGDHMPDFLKRTTKQSSS